MSKKSRCASLTRFISDVVRVLFFIFYFWVSACFIKCRACQTETDTPLTYCVDLVRSKKKTNSAHFNNKTIPFINRCTISCVDDLEGNHCGRCLRDLLFVLTTSCSLLRRISNRCSAGYCALVRLTKESL